MGTYKMSDFPKYKIVQWRKHPKCFYILRRHTRGLVARNVFNKDKFYYRPILARRYTRTFDTVIKAEKFIENLEYKENVVKEIL